jgi:hypothetical protein
MEASLIQAFEKLMPVPPAEADRTVYSVAPLPSFPDCFVGRDSHDHACILVRAEGDESRRPPPIRLESLEVQFDVRSTIRAASQLSEGSFTVIRCRSVDPDLVSYFLSIGETILRILGASPSRAAVAGAVNRLAIIFQRLQAPPVRSLNGLFGELFLIRSSRRPTRTLASWRATDNSRFDFSTGDVRLEVKTAAGRQRIHTFSHDQCNPPPGTTAFVASFFVERAAAGASVGDLMRSIEVLVGADSDLIMKLHEVVAETLGSALRDALAIRFDERLMAGSFRLYDLRSVPAIRGDPPPGVSNIHFLSDLSSLPPISIESLVQIESGLLEFLPDTAL